MKTRYELTQEIKDLENQIELLKHKVSKISDSVDNHNVKVGLLHKLELGSELRLTPAYEKSYRDDAWEANKVGDVITKESDAISFMQSKLIGCGRYKMFYEEFRHNVGEGPGAKVRFEFEEYDIADKISYVGVEGIEL